MVVVVVVVVVAAAVVVVSQSVSLTARQRSKPASVVLSQPDAATATELLRACRRASILRLAARTLSELGLTLGDGPPDLDVGDARTTFGIGRTGIQKHMLIARWRKWPSFACLANTVMGTHFEHVNFSRMCCLCEIFVPGISARNS